MSRYEEGSWENVQRAMERINWRTSMRTPSEVFENTDRALRDFERTAQERLLRGLFEKFGDEFEHRYLTDVIYNARIKLFIHMMVSILFDRDGLTHKERDDRKIAMETSLRDIESLLQP